MTDQPTPSTPSARSRAIRVVGNVLAVVGVVFVVVAVQRHLHALPALAITPALIGALLLGVVANVVAVVLAALNWRALLQAGGATLSTTSSFAIIGRANIAKYVPGNVFHFVGRAGLAAEHGLPAPLVVVTMTIETVAIVAVAAIVGAPAAVARLEAFAALLPAKNIIVAAAIVGVVVVVAGLVVVVRRQKIGVGIGAVGTVLALDALMYLVLGAALHVLLTTAFPSVTLSLPLCVSGFALAWVLGFVTPGAPGGIGVREAVFLVLAAPSMTTSSSPEAATMHAAIAAAIVIGRLQSIVADVGVFVVARALSRRQIFVATIK